LPGSRFEPVLLAYGLTITKSKPSALSSLELLSCMHLALELVSIIVSLHSLEQGTQIFSLHFVFKILVEKLYMQIIVQAESSNILKHP
jgi:hypothetical protein